MKKIAFFLIIIALFSCRKDLDQHITTVDDFETTIYINENPVNASLLGIVTDELGNPVVGAKVTLHSLSTLTNIRGQFLFSNNTMDEAGTYVKVEQEGYFPGSTRFFPKDNSENYASIKLLSKNSIGAFNSIDGGVISSDEGIQIEFPENSIIDERGETYDGQVNVFARLIDPTAADILEIMPGNLVGIDKSEEEVALESFSMIAVELQNDLGEILNMGNERRATVTFPIPEAIIANAPAEIPLWYFDENIGIWKEEGDNAVLEGNNYVGEVAHFSFWNCDYPYPLVNITGKIITQNGLEISNASIVIKQVNPLLGLNGTSGWTDNEGVFAGKVPANTELSLIVNLWNGDGCSPVLTMNLGPFSQDEDLGDIVVEIPNMIEVVGTGLNCSEEPISSGLLTIKLGVLTFTKYLEAENTFQIPLFNCDNVTSLTVELLDLNTAMHSDVITKSISGPVVDCEELYACGNTIDEYIKLVVEGDTYFYYDVYANLNQNMDSIRISGKGVNQEYVNFRIAAKPSGIYDAAENTEYYDISPIGVGGGILFKIPCPVGQNCGLNELIYFSDPAVGEKLDGKLTGIVDVRTPAGDLISQPDFALEFVVTLEN